MMLSCVTARWVGLAKEQKGDLRNQLFSPCIQQQQKITHRGISTKPKCLPKVII